MRKQDYEWFCRLKELVGLEKSRQVRITAGKRKQNRETCLIGELPVLYSSQQAKDWVRQLKTRLGEQQIM